MRHLFRGVTVVLAAVAMMLGLNVASAQAATDIPDQVLCPVIAGPGATVTSTVYYDTGVVNGRPAVSVGHIHADHWQGGPWIKGVYGAMYDLPATGAYKSITFSWANGVTHTPWMDFTPYWTWADAGNPTEIDYVINAYANDGSGTTWAAHCTHYIWP